MTKAFDHTLSIEESQEEKEGKGSNDQRKENQEKNFNRKIHWMILSLNSWIVVKTRMLNMFLLPLRILLVELPQLSAQHLAVFLLEKTLKVQKTRHSNYLVKKSNLKIQFWSNEIFILRKP